MKHTVFEGMATAMITPMTSTGVDYDALERLIEFQIENGIQGLVAVGTTGESATLSPEERKQVIRFTVQKAAGRVPVIAGTGTNNTQHVLDFSKSACDDGADALLVVTPYYNKATQSGLIAHYTAVADAAEKPVIIYNVPSRTGCNVLPETLEVLSHHPNICAVKEASGNMSQVVDILHRCGDRLDVYSGEDALTVAIMAMGGKGCISVLTNVEPKGGSLMAQKALAGDFKGAAELQLKYLPLIDCLFSQVNPIPAKAAMAALGFGQDYVRLPLTNMEEPFRGRMFAEMKKLGIIK